MKFQAKVFLTTFCSLVFHAFCFGQQSKFQALRNTLLPITSSYNATIGIALVDLENNDTFTVNNQHHYPMQSVYKFPLALAILNQVDLGKLSLQQKIRVTEEALLPGTWSPLRDKYPEGNIDLTIADLLYYTVSLSDNNCCDILFRILGGPAEVDRYIHAAGNYEISIAATKESMAKKWETQYANWATPFAISTLLENFYQKKILSDSGTFLLMKLMTESSNSANRIKGLLPIETIVAHKTGTGNTNKQGIQCAVNDAGIITFPNGTHLALTVFVSDSKEKFETSEKIIARISKTIFDFYSKENILKIQLDSLLLASADKPFSGVILVHNHDKVMYSKATGFADNENKKTMKLNSQFVIGSISKQITAVIILQEFEKGHLQLHVPIRKYLKELTMGWADTVTIHQLLTHTHGISGLDQPTRFMPGNQFDYGLSDIGYQILSRIAERTSGKSFAQLSTELFNLCGMKNTFHPDNKKYKSLVKGYSEQENGKILMDSNSFINSPAAGGFISTAGDLVIWNEKLHQGKLLKPETYILMITKQIGAIRQHPVFGTTAYGYGITIDDEDNLLRLGQTGFAPGFISMDFYFPTSKTSVIVLENISYFPNPSFDSDMTRKKFYFHKLVLEAVRQGIKK